VIRGKLVLLDDKQTSETSSWPQYLKTASFISGTIRNQAEPSMICGLTTDDLLPVRGAVFRHVVLKGKIGRIKIGPWVLPGIAKPRVQQAFDDANAAYYSTVDWAIDIREALFVTCDLSGVPARLIRRDPEAQVVVTREKALAGTWRQLNLHKTYWPVSLQWFLDSGEADIVLVAPKRDLKYRTLLEGLQVLRDAGVANPDRVKLIAPFVPRWLVVREATSAVWRACSFPRSATENKEVESL
jgi:hypothetical protein